MFNWGSELGAVKIMLQSRLKSIVLKYLPARILQNCKRIYYLKKLRQATEIPEPDLRVARAWVRPGDTVLDLGANFGLYSIALAEKTGHTGKVYSFEPIPATFELLSANVRKLGYTNISLIEAAISDRAGTVKMEIPNYQSGGQNFYEAHIVSRPRLYQEPKEEDRSSLQRIDVACLTIDQLIRTYSIAKVDFIKCDVEGHERFCLQGASEMLQSFRPVWLIEVSGNPDSPNSSAHELLHSMHQLGYQVYLFDGEKLRLRQKGDRSTNYFFFRNEHLSRLEPEWFAENDQKSQSRAA